MRHKYFGKKLSRTTDERKRLFRSLARDLIVHGKIKTSLAKAKAVQPLVERLITTAKEQTEDSKRRVLAALADRVVVNALVQDSQTRFTKRTSGYTRIIRLGKRIGDGGDVVFLSFVDDRVITEQIKPVSEKTVVKKESIKKEVPTLKLSAKRGRAKKKV